jgi:hypothetical protein
MKFNINSCVWVKLTPKGRRKLRDERMIAEQLINSSWAPSREKNGYTEFQLWELMHIFGEDLFNGSELSFETEILIGEEP